MAEIKFNDNGTITVGIGPETYTIRRPTIGQMFSHLDRITEITDAARIRLEAAITELSEMGDEEDYSPEQTERAAEIRDSLSSNRRGFEWLIVPWLRGVFEELGSAPLPENLDDAPSELTDVTLPSKIVEFWRTVPLAHSPKGRR